MILPTWYELAKREAGVKEIPGKQSHPRIVEYHRSTNLFRRAADKDETPWCASFVNWCLKTAGYQTIDSPRARDWLSFGMELPEPWLGAIAVIVRQDGGFHVGFFGGQKDDHVLLWGGNQTDQVQLSPYPIDSLQGYRWPVLRGIRGALVA